jgi:hypothetical protein
MTGEIPLRSAVFHQPPYTNFVVAGMPVVFFNGGDVDVLDPPQQEWMAALKPTFDKSKEIFLATHQNPWMHTPSGAHFHITREQFRDMEWFMRGWRTNINFMIGHSHGDAYVNFRSGPNKVRLFYSPPSRTAERYGFRPGFMVYCISNGRLVGAIIAFAKTELFTGINLNTGAGAPLYVNITYPYIRPWEECGNVLFRMEEGAYDRANYSVSFKSLFDAKTLLHYCRRYTVRLPGDTFPAATRALVALNLTNAVEVYLGSAHGYWTNYPIQGFTNFIARVDVPESLRGAPIWMMVTNTAPGEHYGALDVAGFGLGTTNAITDFEAWCGREFGDYRISEETEIWPGVSAWTAYFFVLDPRRLDQSRDIEGNPWLTIGPAMPNGDVVLNWSTVTGRVYTVEWSTNAFNGFQALEAASNLPPEITRMTNSAPGGPLFYRLQVQEQ